MLQLTEVSHCRRESTSSREARRRIAGSSSCLPGPSEPTAEIMRALPGYR